MGQLLEFTNLKFRFGPRDASLNELVGADALHKIEKAFPQTSPESLQILVRETLRFLYIATFSPGNLFFPGNQDMDQVWHELIVDTRGYRLLCNELKAGSFIDHWGVSYDDYSENKTAEELHEERLSWIASYVHNFGPMEQAAYEITPLAQSLCENLSMSPTELNQLAQNLAEMSLDKSASKNFDLESYVRSEVAANAAELDKSHYVVKSFIKEILTGVRSADQRNPVLLTNDELELVFSESTSLGFTFGQHLAAVERLSDSPTWQENNPEIWAALSQAKQLCGLATTHLVKPGPAVLTGQKTEGGYVVNGVAPWSCGYKIFDHLVIAFDAGDEIVFATTEYPKSLTTNLGVKVTPHRLICLNGTASVRFDFKDTFVSDKSVISTRQKSSEVKMRPSRYIGYEIGIGKSALARVKTEATKGTHPRNARILQAAEKLETRLPQIMEMRAHQPMNPELGVLNYEFNRDSIRLLSIVMGARALMETSPVGRWQLEIILFDAVIQAPKAIEMKIERIERG